VNSKRDPGGVGGPGEGGPTRAGSTRVRSTRANSLKLIVFAAVSVVLTTVVVATLLDLDTSPTNRYRAVFANASGLQSGDIVAIAGVEVGKVGAVSLRHDRAVVSFSVNADQQLTTTTTATVGFENLLGNRYLDLARGPSVGSPLPPGSTIPESRTSPGLDLTALFDGFQPLFSALTPSQINAFTASVIQVLQGESGTLSGLLSQTATLTANLADRGQLIDAVIDNLTPLLRSVAAHDSQLGALITGLRAFVDGLAADRGQIGAAISSVGSLTTHLSHILGQSQPALDKDIAGLAGASQVLAGDQGQIDRFLGYLTPFVRTLTKVSDSGNYLSVYVCNLSLAAVGSLQVSLVPGVTGTLDLPTGPVGNPAYHTENCA
jgi:phospholipid/cholesterol/gamma-HCH transport system substrate-binding protein